MTVQRNDFSPRFHTQRRLELRTPSVGLDLAPLGPDSAAWVAQLTIFASAVETREDATGVVPRWTASSCDYPLTRADAQALVEALTVLLG